MKNTNIEDAQFNNLDDETKLYILKTIYSMTTSIAKQTYEIKKSINKYCTKGLI